MPRVSDVPQALRPYLFHGLDLGWRDGATEATGDCPFCGRDGKFSVNMDTGQWRCFYCNTGTDNGKVTRGGNALTFLRELWRVCDDATTGYGELARSRGLVSVDTPVAWGAVRSVFTGEWLIPGYGPDRKLVQLYRYSQAPGRKAVLLATPDHGHGLFGANLWLNHRDDVYLCEGPWDGMALWEALSRTARGAGGEWLPARSYRDCLLAGANVVAVPGASSFSDAWLPLFSGRRVHLMYDNDHPRSLPSGANVRPGLDGMRRVASLLMAAAPPPVTITYLRWGNDGHDPDLPTGWDVRDAITAGGGRAANRAAATGALLDRVAPVPDDWTSPTAVAEARGGASLRPKECTSWRVLEASWRKALKWIPGLRKAILCCLASCTSVRMPKDQLWLRVIGPASCGKSTLAEALTVCGKYIYAKSTIRGFHSGYQNDKDGSEDNSMIPKIRDRTLLTKDGDTILKSPNRLQIMSEARDLFDRVARTSYRNKMSRDHTGVNFTWILMGTDALRELDESELGSRFVDVVIMSDIDDDLEDEIGRRAINDLDLVKGMEANGKADTSQSRRLTDAMRLTGGYVEYLRDNARRLLSEVDFTDDAKGLCQVLGKFVAHMRARPSKGQDEAVNREMATRLRIQLGKLALCGAVVLNRPATDGPVLDLVRAVALDSAYGRSLRLAMVLLREGAGGLDAHTIYVETGDRSSVKTRELLAFLADIHVVERFRPLIAVGTYGQTRWRLTTRFAAMLTAATGTEAPLDELRNHGASEEYGHDEEDD